MSRLLMLGCGGATPGGTLFNGAQVKKASDQTAANYTTRTAISWDTEVTDSAGFHDAGADTRLTIPAQYNNYYVVLYASLYIGATSQNHEVCIFKNGDRNYKGASGTGRNVGSSGLDGTGGIAFIQCRTQPILVSTSDYFEVTLRNDTDSSITIDAARSSFSIVVIGTSLTGCLVTNSADLTTQNYSAGGTVTWNSEVYDSDGFHDNVTNNTRLTIPAGVNGRYGIIKGCLFYAAVSNTSLIAASINKNGAITTLDAFEQYQFSGTTSGDIWVEIETPPVLLTTGDIYILNTFCNDNSITVSQYSTFGIEVLPVGFNGVLCQLSGDQTAANYSTAAALPFAGADVYDTAAAHDPSSSNSKIIIPAAWNNKVGVFTATVNSTSVTASSGISLSIRRGGSNSYTGVGGISGNPGGWTTSSINCHSCPITLTAGEEYEAFYYMADTSVNIQSEVTSFSLRLLEYS